MEINGRQINTKGIAVASNKHSEQHQHQNSHPQYQHSQHKHQHSQHQHSQHQHQHCREASRFDKKEYFIHIQSVLIQYLTKSLCSHSKRYLLSAVDTEK